MAPRLVLRRPAGAPVEAAAEPAPPPQGGRRPRGPGPIRGALGTGPPPRAPQDVPPPHFSPRLWFNADLDEAALWSQVRPGVVVGDLLECTLSSSAARLLCRMDVIYQEAEAGLMVEATFLEASPLSERAAWASALSQGSASGYLLHLCFPHSPTHAPGSRCLAVIAGWSIVHITRWRTWPAAATEFVLLSFLPGNGHGPCPPPGGPSAEDGTGGQGDTSFFSLPGAASSAPAATAVGPRPCGLGGASHLLVQGSLPVTAALSGDRRTRPATDLAAERFGSLAAEHGFLSANRAEEDTNRKNSRAVSPPADGRLSLLKGRLAEARRRKGVGATLASRAAEHSQAPQALADLSPTLPPEAAKTKRSSDRPRGRKRRRRHLRSPSSSSRSRSESLFREGHPVQDFRNRVQEIARQRPGALLRGGLAEMAKYLAPRRPNGVGQDPHEPSSTLNTSAVAYFTTVIQALKGKELSIRHERELRTLSECLDRLTSGDLAGLGDTLMQRFKSVELAAADNSWGMAKHLELIPPAQVTTVSATERRMAAALELQERKLEEMTSRAKRGPLWRGQAG